MRPGYRLLRSPIFLVLLLCLWGVWFSWPFITDTFSYDTGTGYLALCGKWLLLSCVLAVISRFRRLDGKPDEIPVAYRVGEED